MKPLLILFVHGLDSTPENTWGQFRRLIDEDDKLGSIADVAFFRYDTAKMRLPILSLGRLQKVSDLARGLRTEIDERYGEYGHIVLVGHSMGGLIVRQYLVSEARDHAALRATKAILFAVPNQGSELAAMGSSIWKSHPQLADLTPDSPFLDSLNADWGHFNLDALVSTLR